MNLALLVVIANSFRLGSQTLHPGFNGIWMGPAREALVLTKGGGEFFWNERPGSIGSLNLAPAGNYVSTWRISAELAAGMATGGRDGLEAGSLYIMEKGAASSGDFLLNLGPVSGGFIKTMNASMRWEHGVRWGGMLTWIGRLDLISVAGKFADSHVSIDVAEKPKSDADGSTVTGSLVANGVRWKLSGDRLASRCVFRLQDMTTGATVGGGVFVWAPSGKMLEKLRDREATGTDSVYLTFGAVGSGFPNGMHGMLAAVTK